MKILNYGVTATHPTIVNLASFTDATSISDFDAFVFDPNFLVDELVSRASQRKPWTLIFNSEPHGHSIQRTILRRQKELIQLLTSKGGVVICLLRENDLTLQAAGQDGSCLNFNKYAFLQRMNVPWEQIAGGAGLGIRGTNLHGAATEYIEILKGHLEFSAHLAVSTKQFNELGKVLATDSVGNPVAVELQVGTGMVALLPVPHDVTGDRVGAAIVQTVRRFFASDLEIEEPGWASDAMIPGADRHNEEIVRLEEQYTQLKAQIDSLKAERQGLSDYRKLLFGYGKVLLEPTVRRAFRLFDFAVPEPDEYPQDWDAFLTSPEGRTAICEIEGSENAIEVRKYRQLLDYIDVETQEGRNHKGILVGNGFRHLPLNASERQSQFTEHVLRGAERNQFCLVPTTELFKAVCAVLEDPSNQQLQGAIRDSLFSVVGPWTFAR